jgi:hypothetical protein
MDELTQCSAAIRKYKRHVTNEHRQGALSYSTAMRFTAKLNEWEAQLRKESAVSEVLRTNNGEVTE